MSKGNRRTNPVKKTVLAAAIATTMTLAACGQPQEAANVENAYDNQADAIDNMADNMEQAGDNLTGAAAAANENAVDRLEDKADAVRNAGDEKADAIEKNAM